MDEALAAPPVASCDSLSCDVAILTVSAVAHPLRHMAANIHQAVWMLTVNRLRVGCSLSLRGKAAAGFNVSMTSNKRINHRHTVILLGNFSPGDVLEPNERVDHEYVQTVVE